MLENPVQVLNPPLPYDNSASKQEITQWRLLQNKHVIQWFSILNTKVEHIRSGVRSRKKALFFIMQGLGPSSKLLVKENQKPLSKNEEELSFWEWKKKRRKKQDSGKWSW